MTSEARYRFHYFTTRTDSLFKTLLQYSQGMPSQTIPRGAKEKVSRAHVNLTVVNFKGRVEVISEKPVIRGCIYESFPQRPLNVDHPQGKNIQRTNG